MTALTKWHFIFLIAIVLAATSQAQTNLPSELPGKETEEKIKNPQGVVQIQPEAHDLLKGAPPEVPVAAPKTDLALKKTSPDQMFGAHLGLGLPHPFFAGFDWLSSSKTWSASLDAGAFGVKVDTVTVSLMNYEAALRYHPWAGSFFVGTAVGRQSIKAKATDTISGQSLTAEANVTTTYYTPQLGWHWGWDSGFQLGFEFGAQLSGSTSTDFSSNAASYGITEANSTDYAKLAKDARDKGDLIGKATLPYLTLLRLGWLF